LHQFVLQFLGLFAVFAAIVAWFAILITGRFPRAFFYYIVGVMRWYLRVSAYSSLMRDEFPPFSKRVDARPGSGRAVAVSVVGALVFIPATVAGIVALSAIDAQTHEVQVRYSEVLAGNASESAHVDGNLVTVLSAADPAAPRRARPARAGHRLTSFELEVWNYDSIFTSVGLDAFQLKDSLGRELEPLTVDSTSLTPGNIVESGDTVVVEVVFEVRGVAEPASLTYSPGFAAYLPFGERVRFEFR
jgi:hypothetical protein